jgi:hypothetical protein
MRDPVCPLTPTATDTAPACLAASKSGCKTACGGGCGGRMTARMGCSVSSATNVCSDNIKSGRFLGRALGADSFATYVPGKPDAGNSPVRFDEGRELADSPRPAPAYSTPPSARPKLGQRRGRAECAARRPPAVAGATLKAPSGHGHSPRIRASVERLGRVGCGSFSRPVTKQNQPGWPDSRS